MHPQYEIGSGVRPFKTDHSDTSIKVHLNIESNETRITMETDESYKLKAYCINFQEIEPNSRPIGPIQCISRQSLGIY